MAKPILIGFPILNEGRTPSEREQYEQKVEPILLRNGIRRIARYETIQHMSGSLQGALGVGLWELDGADAFEALQSDPDYQAIIEWRDQIHDMKRLTMYLTSPTFDDGPVAAGNSALLDLVVLNPGMTLDDRAEYGKAIAPIAARYGASVKRSFRIDRHLGGELPEAVEFNIWELPDPGAVGKMLADPEYQANITERDRIHDMDRLTMILARPAA